MRTSTYEWLPERHLGVVAHADQLIEQVGNLLFEYLRQERDVVSLREVPRGDVNLTVVESITPITRKVALLVTDVLVALRAAMVSTVLVLKLVHHVVDGGRVGVCLLTARGSGLTDSAQDEHC